MLITIPGRALYKYGRGLVSLQLPLFNNLPVTPRRAFGHSLTPTV